jgi:hypothetical protein
MGEKNFHIIQGGIGYPFLLVLILFAFNENILLHKEIEAS